MRSIPAIGFIVAVTYDGNDGAPGNLKLYWTRIAARPGRGQSDRQWLAGRRLVHGVWAISRSATPAAPLHGSGECNPFPGLIDEVRISSIARQAEDFFFVNPEAKAAVARQSEARDPTGRTDSS